MDRIRIENDIYNFFRTHRDFKDNLPADFHKDSHLLQSSLLDSLNVIQLIIFLEQAFSIEINPLDFTSDDIKSISTITDYVLAYAKK